MTLIVGILMVFVFGVGVVSIIFGFSNLIHDLMVMMGIMTGSPHGLASAACPIITGFVLLVVASALSRVVGSLLKQ